MGRPGWGGPRIWTYWGMRACVWLRRARVIDLARLAKPIPTHARHQCSGVSDENVVGETGADALRRLLFGGRVAVSHSKDDPPCMRCAQAATMRMRKMRRCPAGPMCMSSVARWEWPPAGLELLLPHMEAGLA